MQFFVYLEFFRWNRQGLLAKLTKPCRKGDYALSVLVSLKKQTLLNFQVSVLIFLFVMFELCYIYIVESEQ
jgi:hypothetical protein